MYCSAFPPIPHHSTALCHTLPHAVQMDLVSVADGLAQRQEQLAEAVSTLAGALSNMQTAKAHNVGGLRSGELPWM